MNSKWINPHSEFSPVNTLATCCLYYHFPHCQPHFQASPEPFLQLEVCRIHTFFLVLQWSAKKKNRSESVSPSAVSDSSDPMNCTLPGSFVCGIFQARILEWVAIPFSRGSSWPRDWTWVSCIAGRFFTIWDTREALIRTVKLKICVACFILVVWTQTCNIFQVGLYILSTSWHHYGAGKIRHYCVSYIRLKTKSERPSYILITQLSTLFSICLSQGHVVFPGQPTSNDYLI